MAWLLHGLASYVYGIRAETYTECYNKTISTYIYGSYKIILLWEHNISFDIILSFILWCCCCCRFFFFFFLVCSLDNFYYAVCNSFWKGSPRVFCLMTKEIFNKNTMTPRPNCWWKINVQQRNSYLFEGRQLDTDWILWY